MSSSRIENSGHFHSAGTQVIGSSINGDVHFHASSTVRALKSFRLGLRLGEAPAIEAHLFVGRSSELQTIEEILHPQDTLQEQQRVILGGLGGVGKTQLTVAYARQYHYLHGSTFWLNASASLCSR